ncbi:hypothetical protein BKA59DRAFT_118915 [Fusarium tricinctum]|uniref:Uncharacterized protein n=1 Tax=Fusarium tricinctum TaxID=61284 RepID=A0A8K0S6K6_9HYPO|nr:hypothetical protein BKA59DRAFT_118915 [Fusarium tricinctum]
MSNASPPAEVIGQNPYGISDIASFIDENSEVWKAVPGEEDWAKIRFGGNRKKTWPMNIAIEVAFREFEAAGADVNAQTREILAQTKLTTLLVEVLDIIAKHYDGLASEPQYGENCKIVGKSRLIRTTKDAAKHAVTAFFNGGTYGERETHYTTFLPRHAKVLACRFVTAHGSIDGSIAGWLAACSQAHLCQV